jgi:predicted nucleic acid-binding protein
VVVDASVAVASAMGEDVATGAWAHWLDRGAMLLAPCIVWPEIGNALVRGMGLGAADAVRLLGMVRRSGLESADRGPDGLDHAVELAARHRLTVYDATYLSLAIDIDAELATLDRTLARAAAAEGVPLAIPT